MLMKKRGILVVLLVFARLAIFAQFQISAEFRPRAEMRSGYKMLKADTLDAAWIVSQRTRLIADFKKSFYSFRVSIQDVRLWGDETIVSSTGVFGDEASLDLNEAWMELKFLKYSSLKIGRQYFAYDDYRLLWHRNWNQHSLSYDALLYRFDHPFLTADLGFSWNNTMDLLYENFFPANRIKSLNFLHLSKSWNDHFRSNILIMLTGYEKSDTSNIINFRNTFGAYLDYEKGILSLDGSLYRQNGKNTAGFDVDAWCISANARVDLGIVEARIGGVVLSGNDAYAGGTDHLFDVFYGARHRYYGYMDYFSNIPKSTRKAGLEDYFAGLDVHLSQKLKMAVDYHYFRLANSIILNGVKMKRDLASEIDLTCKWGLYSDISLQVGYSIMLPEATLEKLQGFDEGESSFSSWAWMMLSAKIR